jgi:hypothetical protein
MGKMIYTAIVFMADKSPPRKYHNVQNLISFANFCKTINAHYFNLYEKSSKKYKSRIYLEMNKKGEE